MTETGSLKRVLLRDIALYTLFRLALVAVIAVLLYGIGRIFTEDVPPVPVFLFALVIALPLSMVVGKKLRERVSRGAAAIDEARKEKRNDFRKRLQGADE